MESMGAAFDESFKKRYRRNKEALEWYDALAMAVAVIAIVFTFFVRIVKVDGHSMDPTLFNGERILINLMKQPDYGDIVVVDGYTSYGKPLVKRVIGKGGDTIDIDFAAGIVYRNGVALDEPYTAEPTYLYESGLSHHGAGRLPFCDGRQPQQFHRQPRFPRGLRGRT